jgi:glucose/arabinose dehydrogenase/cytochrome c2
MKKGMTVTATAVAIALVAVAASAEWESKDKASAQNQFWVEQVTDKLNFPASVTWLPNGDALIIERLGGLRLLPKGQDASVPVDGVPPSFKFGMADGFRDVAVDPDFSTNKQLYLFFSEGDKNARHAAVYRTRLNGTKLDKLVRIFKSEDLPAPAYSTLPTRLMFLPDKTLLISVAAPEARKEAQQLNSTVGKIMRINRDGTIPADNPFKTTAGAIPSIWAYGFRALLGLSIDSQGTIWEVEAGARGGDELNVVKPGKNYGWGEISWSFNYKNNGSETPNQSRAGVEDPTLIWTPSVSPSGIVRYEGKNFPDWSGDLFVAQLTSKVLERVRLDDQRRVVERQVLLRDFGERIRDVKVGPDGFIYVLTDSPEGRLLRLRPGTPTAAENGRVAKKLKETFEPYGAPIALGDPAEGKRVFEEHCATCHTAGADAPGGDLGPDLKGVVGRKMGSVAGYSYSSSMTLQGSLMGAWTTERLNVFLMSPDSYIAGTTMSIPPISDEKQRGALIAYLKQTGS